jgi:hypothetical protein
MRRVWFLGPLDLGWSQDFSWSMSAFHATFSYLPHPCETSPPSLLDVEIRLGVTHLFGLLSPVHPLCGDGGR